MENMSPSPAWIYKRDGQLVPFEADKISQSLFAATESLNRPDAFTARELTDGVLHFLAGESSGGIPNTAQVAELVVKVVRELGQSTIAQAYADFAGRKNLADEREVGRATRQKANLPFELPSPETLAQYDPRSLVSTIAGKHLQDYSLREIFTRDIAAAHKEGFITLKGLETPFELQGGVLAPAEIDQLMETIEASRSNFGQFIALDNPEYMDQAVSEISGGKWIREFLIGLRATGLHAVVNLNCATLPPWSQKLAAGPLFTSSQAASPHESAESPADHLRDRILNQQSPLVRIQWHLGEGDFLSKNAGRIGPLARLILDGAPIRITFDRPGRSVSLAEGLDRNHAALLITVGVHLPRLARQAGVAGSPDRFLQKLGSLARLALTAAVQKRRFLVRHRRQQPAFLVDRARLAVVPVGLEEVTRNYIGQEILPRSPAADFACRIVQTLHQTLHDEGPTHNLDACLDSSPGIVASDQWPVASHQSQTATSHGPFLTSQDTGPSLEQIAGLTSWNGAISIREQMQVSGLLQGPVQSGTAWILLPKEGPVNEEELTALLRFAWKETGISRLQFVSPESFSVVPRPPSG